MTLAASAELAPSCGSQDTSPPSDDVNASMSCCDSSDTVLTNKNGQGLAESELNSADSCSLIVGANQTAAGTVASRASVHPRADSNDAEGIGE